MSNPGLSNLVSHWSLEEAAGNGDRIDDVGTNPLTAVHSPGQVTGVVDNAVDFITTNDELTILDAVQVGLDFDDVDFSACWWAKFTRQSAYEGLISRWSTSGQFSYYCHRGQDKKIEWFVSHNGVNYVVKKHPDVLDITTWYFVYVYHDQGTEIGVSVDDGTIATEVQTNGVDGAGSNSNFNLGMRSDGAEDLVGNMDQVAIFSDLLTAEEITWMYNTGSGRSYAEIAAVAAGGAKRSATFF